MESLLLPKESFLVGGSFMIWYCMGILKYISIILIVSYLNPDHFYVLACRCITRVVGLISVVFSMITQVPLALIPTKKLAAYGLRSECEGHYYA